MDKFESVPRRVRGGFKEGSDKKDVPGGISADQVRRRDPYSKREHLFFSFPIRTRLKSFSLLTFPLVSSYFAPEEIEGKLNDLVPNRPVKHVALGKLR